MSKMAAIVFENARNQELVGVLHHGTGPGPRPCLVVCHGFAGTKVGGSRRFVAFARHAVQFNLSVFRFDFVGSGDSDGDLAELSLADQLDDLRSAIDAVGQLPSIDPERIGVVGHCLGAVTAIRACARNERIGRAVAWAPFTDLPGTLMRLIGEDAFGLLEQGETADFLYNNQLFQCGPQILAESERFNMVEDVLAVRQPLLVVHGSEDSTVPLWEVQHLMDLTCQAPGKRQLEVLKGAHHSFPFHQSELFDATLKWFHDW